VIEFLLRMLLGMAPRGVRRRLMGEMLDVYRARSREVRSRGGNMAFGLRELWGAARLVAGMWAEGARDRSGRGGRGRRGGTVEALAGDLRVAGRGLRRNPGYAIAALVVLALGIGANTTIFSTANALFFRPLPFLDPDRLVTLYETNPEFGWVDAAAAPANALDWRERIQGFEDVAVHAEFASPRTWMGYDGAPRLLRAVTVSGNFFDVLGVRAELGRTFRWEETWAPDDRVVLLGHDLWRSEFGGDPTVVGRIMDLGGVPTEVVGVLPPGFTYPLPGTQLWLPYGWSRADRAEVWFRRAHFVRPVARLAPGATLQDANAELQGVVADLSREYPETNRVMGAGVSPLRGFLTRETRGRVLLLGGAVALLLVLACVNVATLSLVRGSEREREVAIRHALGAGRGRVARLLLAESVLVAGLGGALGLGVGWIAIRFLEGRIPLGVEGVTALSLDLRVAAFVALTTGLVGVAVGLLPALRAASSKGRGTALAGTGRAGTPDRGRVRLLDALVAAEVGLALLLVAGAGLTVRSYLLLRDVDPGFRTGGTAAVHFLIPPGSHPSREEVLAFQDAFLERVRALPGVEAAGSAGHLPLDGTGWSSQFQAEGWPAERVGFEVLHRRADAGYFEALGIPLLQGRMFGSGDGPEASPVVLVNRSFVDRHFPGEDPVGERIANDREAASRPAEHTWYEIVGVVGDQHQTSPAEPPRPEIIEHRSQDWNRGNWVVFRTEGDPLDAVPAIREILRSLDATIPLGEVRSLREVWTRSMARERMVLTLLGVFGVTALLVAAVGVYAVTAQAARARTREMGIRMALGASASRVVGTMVRQGLTVVGAGLGLGLLGVVPAGRALRGFLYGVGPGDPGTLVAVVAVLAAVAAVACYLPARRVTAADPVRALRDG
jgi:putative ABC transport system permease protein